MTFPPAPSGSLDTTSESNTVFVDFEIGLSTIRGERDVDSREEKNKGNNIQTAVRSNERSVSFGTNIRRTLMDLASFCDGQTCSNAKSVSSRGCKRGKTKFGM